MLNLKDKEDQKIYISSDWHLNHDREFVWKTRGYSSKEEHNNDIIDKTNSIVRENDILINLGDITLNTTIEEFETFIARINCKNMYLMFGNHPNPHYKKIYLPMVKQFFGDSYTPECEVYPLRYKNVIYIGHYAEIIWNGQRVILSHYPIFSWNHMSEASFHLHGHEHSAVQNHLPEGKNGKILDVGWDYFKKPLSFNEIKIIMDAKNVSSIGHH